MVACWNGNTDMINFLLNKFCKTDVVDKAIDISVIVCKL